MYDESGIGLQWACADMMKDAEVYKNNMVSIVSNVPTRVVAPALGQA
jgi:hypothetical protein